MRPGVGLRLVLRTAYADRLQKRPTRFPLNRKWRWVKPGMSDKNGTDARIGEAPRIFVSYTHESPDHKRWVSDLARKLRDNGVDVVLDQWDLGLGDDATLFMEKGIGDAERVLLVCTPSYCRKANEGMGGVGYERLVVTSEIAAKIDTNKFICVLRAGSKDESIPTFATRIYVDFTGTTDFELAFDSLLRDIRRVPQIPSHRLARTRSNRILLGFQVSTTSSPSSWKRHQLQTLRAVYAQAVRLLHWDDTAQMESLRTPASSKRAHSPGSMARRCREGH